MKRFWDKVDKSGECWLWTASRESAHGPGQFFLTERKPYLKIKAHRMAWELTNGPVPVREGSHGSCVLRTCGNVLCVNPGHMVIGSIADSNRMTGAKRRGLNAGG